MIIDITGTVLTPGNFGAACLGNGRHFDGSGEWIECCCDECDYLLCCAEKTDCLSCTDGDCPANGKTQG